MFFLMKFCFWLALVYAAILYGAGPFGPSSVGGRTTKTTSTRAEVQPTVADHGTPLHGVVNAAAATVAGLCATHAADCLAEAARLSALFKASAANVPSRDDTKPARDASDDTTISRDAPMPVPDPRRQVRALKLTPHA